MTLHAAPVPDQLVRIKNNTSGSVIVKPSGSHTIEGTSSFNLKKSDAITVVFYDINTDWGIW